MLITASYEDDVAPPQGEHVAIIKLVHKTTTPQFAFSYYPLASIDHTVQAAYGSIGFALVQSISHRQWHLT